MAETRTPEAAADDGMMDDFIELNRQRAATYGLLSRLYRVEVDEALLEKNIFLHILEFFGSH